MKPILCIFGIMLVSTSLFSQNTVIRDQRIGFAILTGFRVYSKAQVDAHLINSVIEPKRRAGMSLGVRAYFPLYQNDKGNELKLGFDVKYSSWSLRYDEFYSASRFQLDEDATTEVNMQFGNFEPCMRLEYYKKKRENRSVLLGVGLNAQLNTPVEPFSRETRYVKDGEEFFSHLVDWNNSEIQDPDNFGVVLTAGIKHHLEGNRSHQLTVELCVNNPVYRRQFRLTGFDSDIEGVLNFNRNYASLNYAFVFR